MDWSNRATIALAMGLAACSGSEIPNSAEATSADRPAGAETRSLPSAEWLAGEWCYERYVAGGEPSEENITYIFNSDGTLLYQNNSSTPVDRPGSFETADGRLVIRPALAPFPFDEATTTEDRMVLRSRSTEFHWTRGACGE